MATKRKARGDSKLDALPDHQHAELVQGLLGGWTYMQAIDWLAVECGVTARLHSFTPFYQRHVGPILVERKQFAALSARTLGKLAKETQAFDAAAIGELKEYAYRLMRDPSGDPEEARKWMETVIKAQAGERNDKALAQKDTLITMKDREISQKDALIEQAERKVKLLEAKAAQADQANAVIGDGKLTAEEKAARLKQIFGMG
jgi:hypothetical protein